MSEEKFGEGFDNEQKSPCVDAGTVKLKPANQHPDFGKVCIHGSLKRQCYTCELEGNNDWLKKVNLSLNDEIARLKEDNLAQRTLIIMLDDECIKLKAQNSKMREVVRESLYFLENLLGYSEDHHDLDILNEPEYVELTKLIQEAEEALKGE